MIALKNKDTVALHSSVTGDWGSPQDVIELARDVLDGIDVDPASSAEWNENVQAKYFLDGSEGRDGLVDPWWPKGKKLPQGGLRVFLNPPGTRKAPLVPKFWERLVMLWSEGVVDSAVWVGFSLEQLPMLSRRYDPSPLSPMFPLMFPTSRLDFLSAETREPHGSPTHGNYLCLLPSPLRNARQTEAWTREAEKRGWVTR